jgi:iron(III) transport system substrate-binding protein
MLLQTILCFLVLIFSVPPAWAQGQSWEKQWADWLAGAKKEGKVVVAGSPDPEVRKGLLEGFRAKFGIPLEYISGRSDLAEKLKAERQAGLSTVDVFFSGSTTFATILYPEKMLDPLKPELILPEIVDPSKWKIGKPWFVDPEEKYILRLLNYTTYQIYINQQHVKPEELKSAKDLLNPKWKGRIAAYDPTVAGTGSNDATIFYLQLGEDFVKKLYIDQNPVVSRDRRQIADWLARGSYPIAVSADTGLIRRLQQEGFPVMTVTHLPDAPGSLSAGNGMVALMSQAPHPNAARLFVNWIASKEGLQIYARARLNPTTRNDLDESYAPAEEMPRPGGKYFDSASWSYTVTDKEKVMKRLKEILKR